MGDKTGIEWTDATWNPVRGCSRVSTGCEHCYAEQVASRFSGPGLPYEGLAEGGRWTGKLRLVPEKLDMPLRWQKPRRIFVNSMSDLFHPEVPFGYVAAVFGVMAASPRHTFQVLTKRPERMLEFFRWLDDQKDEVSGFPGRSHLCGRYAAQRITRDFGISGIEWPLPNVWLGVTAEDQAAADERIPLLLQCPASIRFVSVEPMVGPVNLSRWLTPIAPMQPEDAPKTWADWTWPEWIPEDIRKQIEKFWCEDWGRGPQAWLRDMIGQGSPPFVGQKGSGITKEATGRWVHCWNNIGRLIDDDGIAHFSSIPRVGLFDFSPPKIWQPIQWIICGGESGPGARPMQPDWARSLRDQCAEAGVPFLFKQWGEWAPASDVDVCHPAMGTASGDPGRHDFGAHEGGTGIVLRVGKRTAGRDLDGVIHDEYPKETER